MTQITAQEQTTATATEILNTRALMRDLEDAENAVRAIRATLHHQHQTILIMLRHVPGLSAEQKYHNMISAMSLTDEQRQFIWFYLVQKE